jgi:hypothetical protein
VFNEIKSVNNFQDILLEEICDPYSLATKPLQQQKRAVQPYAHACVYPAFLEKKFQKKGATLVGSIPLDHRPFRKGFQV